MVPSVEMAHLIPWSENDTWRNIIPLRSDLHKEYDAQNPLWAFDPNDRRESSKPGFIQFGIVLSNIGWIDQSSCRHFAGDDALTELRRKEASYREEIEKLRPGYLEIWDACRRCPGIREFWEECRKTDNKTPVSFAFSQGYYDIREESLPLIEKAYERFRDLKR